MSCLVPHPVVPGSGDLVSQAGRLYTVSLSPQGFQVAYVVFQKPSGVASALKLKGPLLVSTESHRVKSGIYSQYCWLCPMLPPRALGW